MESLCKKQIELTDFFNSHLRVDFLRLKESEMNIEEYLDELIKREGGYVNNQVDKGGVTKYGITEAVARKKGYKGNMKDLPRKLLDSPAL